MTPNDNSRVHCGPSAAARSGTPRPGVCPSRTAFFGASQPTGAGPTLSTVTIATTPSQNRENPQPDFPGPLRAHNIGRVSLHKRGVRRPPGETFDEGQISNSIPSISLESQDL